MIKIAVIGANEPLLPFYRQAKALGYYIIGIAWAEGAVCKTYCDKFYPVSFGEEDEVLRICRDEQVDGITSFSLESALPTVVYVAQHMGLVSNTEECVRLTSTKFAQRVAFEKNGIAVPRYYMLESESDLKGKEFRYPVIFKPLDSGGSQGITKVDAPVGLSAAYAAAVSHSRSGRVIVEEFIDGREFSVEALSHNGKHYILQITDKVTSEAPHFIEMQHHQPAAIPNDLVDRIKAMVMSALTALKIENSPSHTEIKYNSRGELYIIEIGPRMGGDFISSDLVRLSTGYDMVKGAIELATGRFAQPQLKEKNYAGVYFYSELALYIGDIIRNHDKYPEIVKWELKEGDLPKAESNSDRGGYFIYKNKTKKMTFKDVF